MSTTGSDIVVALESAYGFIRKNHDELPDIVINIGTGIRGRQSRWGHFHHDRWVDAINNGRLPELFIAGERLACDAEQVLQTMLHECAHALGAVRDIKNTSGASNKYHNKFFLSLAKEFTLDYPHDNADSQFGYSFVENTDKTLEVYADALEAIKDATKLFLDGQGGTNGPKKPKAKDRNLIKCVCDCIPPYVVRMSQKVLDSRAVFCSVCEYEFSEDY